MGKFIKKLLEKRRRRKAMKICGGNCGQCVFLGSVWKHNEFKGLYCKRGIW